MIEYLRMFLFIPLLFVEEICSNKDCHRSCSVVDDISQESLNVLTRIAFCSFIKSIKVK
jgi:hypothetical protein